MNIKKFNSSIMGKFLLKTAFLGVIFLALFSSASSQDLKKETAQKTLDKGKNVAVVIVGSAAKLSYKATKFSANKIAKPIVVKSAPKVAKFMLKQSGKTIKSSLPIAKKAIIQYVKYKFLP